MKKSHKPSSAASNPKQKPKNATVPSPPPPSSSQTNGDSLTQPHLVDLARCNHQKFWKSVTRNFARYLACFKPADEPTRRKRGKGKSGRSKSTRGDGKSQRECNHYYREMNDEERYERLKSAISYCKNSSFQVQDDPYSEMNSDEHHKKLKSAIAYCKNSNCRDDPHQGVSHRVLNS